MSYPPFARAYNATVARDQMGLPISFVDLGGIVAAGRQDTELMRLAGPRPSGKPDEPDEVDSFLETVRMMELDAADEVDLGDIDTLLLELDAGGGGPAAAPVAASAAPVAASAAPVASATILLGQPYFTAPVKPLVYTGLVTRRTRQPNEQPMEPVTTRTLKHRVFGVNPCK